MFPIYSYLSPTRTPPQKGGKKPNENEIGAENFFENENLTSNINLSIMD